MTDEAAPVQGLEPVLDAIGESGLIVPGESVIALVSGGPDSACLVAGLAAWLDPGNLVALHFNYGLREGAADDAEVAARLCEHLGVDLVTVEAEGEPDGNVLDWARRLRYEEAERLRLDSGADWVAAGHTATDVAETMIHRLAASPGSRALLGMRAKSGRVVRPLLGLERAETRHAATRAGLEFADDPSNLDPKFSRSRIRAEVLPVLEQINPAAVSNLLATRAELSEEAELLDLLAGESITLARAGEDCLAVERLEETPTVLRRLVFRAFAESVLGFSPPVTVEKAATIWRLAQRPEGGRVDLIREAAYVAESGLIRVVPGEAGEPGAEVGLNVPGAVEWAGWTVKATRLEPPFAPLGPEVATLDGEALGRRLRVRGWQSGDLILPLGMAGHKSLQDLFTDNQVPRSLRRRIPVVLSGDEIAWVAGVAIGDDFKLGASTTTAVRLSAVRSSHSP